MPSACALPLLSYGHLHFDFNFIQMEQNIIPTTTISKPDFVLYLQSQNTVCSHLGFKGIRTPVALPTAADSRLIINLLQPGGTSKVRLLKFIPGNTLKAAVKVQKPSALWTVVNTLAQRDLSSTSPLSSFCQTKPQQLLMVRNAILSTL